MIGKFFQRIWPVWKLAEDIDSGLASVFSFSIYGSLFGGKRRCGQSGTFFVDKNIGGLRLVQDGAMTASRELPESLEAVRPNRTKVCFVILLSWTKKGAGGFEPLGPQFPNLSKLELE